MICGHFQMPKKNRRQKRKKQNEKTIKQKIIRDIWTLFKQDEEEENYYKPKRLNNFWNNIYTEYESNGDKTRNLSLDKYFHKIKTYLRNIVINLQKFDAFKFQLTITINFKRVMHANSDNVKVTPYGDGNDVIDKLFKSLFSIYQ